MTWQVILENEQGTQYMDITIGDQEESYDPTTGEKITEKDKVLEIAKRQNEKFSKAYDRDPYKLKSITKLNDPANLEVHPTSKKMDKK